MAAVGNLKPSASDYIAVVIKVWSLGQLHLLGTPRRPTESEMVLEVRPSSFGEAVEGRGVGYFYQNSYFWMFYQVSHSRQKSHLRRVLQAERKPPLRAQPLPPRTPRTGLGFSEDHCVSRSL